MNRLKRKELILQILASMLLLTSSLFGEEAKISIDKAKWSTFGETYGVLTRMYHGREFIYSTPRTRELGGMYQGFKTVVGSRYQVSLLVPIPINKRGLMVPHKLQLVIRDLIQTVPMLLGNQKP